MTKSVNAYLERQLQDPAFVAEWLKLLEESDPFDYWRRQRAEVGETSSVPSEETEYINEEVEP